MKLFFIDFYKKSAIFNAEYPITDIPHILPWIVDLHTKKIKTMQSPRNDLEELIRKLLDRRRLITLTPQESSALIEQYTTRLKGQQVFAKICILELGDTPLSYDNRGPRTLNIAKHDSQSLEERLLFPCNREGQILADVSRKDLSETQGELTHRIVGLNQNYDWMSVKVIAEIQHWDELPKRIWIPTSVEICPHLSIPGLQKLTSFNNIQFLIGMIEAVNLRCRMAMEEIRGCDQIADPLRELIAQVSI